MKQLTLSCRIGAALALLALVFPCVAQAQQPVRDTVAFKATVGGIADGFVVPTDPPVLSGRLNFKGTSDLLGGAVTFLDQHIGHLGVDGTFTRSTDGHGVFTGANGDAICIQWAGTARPTDKAGVYAFAGGFTITGGKGRFTGASGHGIMNSTVNFNNFEVNQVWEGQVAVLRK
jgi:hypothetical protein